jgi:multicomponent Na+:H+ antiporter subunit C
VVGVATTAVGLALAVRIREAYGTIEEDELETMDNVAEFGDVARERALGASAS